MTDRSDLVGHLKQYHPTLIEGRGFARYKTLRRLHGMAHIHARQHGHEHGLYGYANGGLVELTDPYGRARAAAEQFLPPNVQSYQGYSITRPDPGTQTKKEPTTMNDLQTKTFEYLTEPGHPDRIKALKDLLSINFFNPKAEELSRTALEVAFFDWKAEQKFCKDGYDRARAHLLGDGKPQPDQVTVTLQLEVRPVGSIAKNGDQLTRSGAVANTITALLEGTEVFNDNRTVRVIESARVTHIDNLGPAGRSR